MHPLSFENWSCAGKYHDLTCNPSYNDFLLRDVLPAVRSRHSHLTEGGHLVAGISLSGLAAAFATLKHPSIFSYCIGHSGSFWWNREWLTGQLDKSTPSPRKWWLSVGNKEVIAGVSHPPTAMLQEIAQLPACERFAQALRARGDEVNYRVYDGGHEFEPWAAEFPEALRGIFRGG